MSEYVFDEDNILKEMKKYIDDTYEQHYSSGGRIQVTDFIQSHCNSPDFFRGNAMKYLARYGHKEGQNRKDLQKALHYLIMMIHWHDSQLAVMPGPVVRDTATPEWEYEPIPKEVFDPVKDKLAGHQDGDYWVWSDGAKTHNPPKDNVKRLVPRYDPPMDKYYGDKDIRVKCGDVLSQNVYVQMTDGKIGQIHVDGSISDIGYGELDERGCLIPGTFRYSSERKV